jgi:xanthine dehydrogenase accessory factor
MFLILLRGGGDVASGVALRLLRCGFRLVITELAEPLSVRRTVSFAEAVYEGRWTVEGVTATHAASLDEALDLVRRGGLPVLVAPTLDLLPAFPFDVLVDARLTKLPPDTDRTTAPLVVGLGPGFEAGRDCHAVVETKRGHTIGRVVWSGAALPDTTLPQGDPARVLRAPADGAVVPAVEITQHVEAGQLVAEVSGLPVTSPFAGVLRGLIRPGRFVSRGVKIGDVDPSDMRDDCFLVSDKALAIGGGVVEAILSRADLRARLWS